MLTAIDNKVDAKPAAPNGDGANPFLDLIEEYTYSPPKRGDILQGVVLKIADTLYLDVGAKRDAIVLHHELDQFGDGFLEDISEGDEFPVYVTRTPVGDEQLYVSLERGLMQQDWIRANEALDTDELLKLEIVAYNKGGVLVQYGRLRGFVPNSHVPELRRSHRREDRQSLKARLVGTELMLKIIEVDAKRERLVMSATAAQTEHRQEQLEALQEGATVVGRVVNLVDYGAFVDLGAVHGLLHISKVSWDHIDHPSEVLEIGQELELMVDDVDAERERVSLNRRALLPSPWQHLTENMSEGDLVAGVVTAVLDFGAFVRLPSGIEGLIHVSEMDTAGHSVPKDVLTTGDDVLVRIISIDAKRKRLGLSMRRVSAQETVEWMMHRQQQEEAAEAPVEETTAADEPLVEEFQTEELVAEAA